MKKKTTKVFSVVLVVMLFVATFAVSAFAGDENLIYSFNIQANRNVTRYTVGQFRDTTNNNNAWKVNFKTSNEPGTGRTFTEYVITKSDGTLAASWHSVQVSTGAHYYAANDNGDFATVYLNGRDNNNIASTYTVTGYWDEETGITPD